MSKRKRSKQFYRKDLHQQIHERLVNMQAFGMSKKTDMVQDQTKDKIYSLNTYKTYRKHCMYFGKWVKDAHPEATSLKKAQPYVNEWLTLRTNQKNAAGEPLSAWTIQTEAAALNKLYGIDPADPNRFQPPKRERADIKRSRLETTGDRHFSESNNGELIRFCQGTGCRRSILQKLKGRDLWTYDEMAARAAELESRMASLDAKEAKDLTALRDALSVFPDHRHFIHHIQDKGGRDRYGPVIGPDRDRIVERMQKTGADELVWQHVHSGADIHSYRGDYATQLYRMYARPLDQIPYDKINHGSGRAYQSDVYVCRIDEKGRRLDRAAMVKCSKALGHNRPSVVADNYLRGL